MSEFDLILLGGHVVLDNKIEKHDIGIKGSLISKIGDLSRSSSAKKIDVSATGGRKNDCIEGKV